jgi:hypothetical protein
MGIRPINYEGCIVRASASIPSNAVECRSLASGIDLPSYLGPRDFISKIEK